MTRKQLAVRRRIINRNKPKYFNLCLALTTALQFLGLPIWLVLLVSGMSAFAHTMMLFAIMFGLVCCATWYTVLWKKMIENVRAAHGDRFVRFVYDY